MTRLAEVLGVSAKAVYYYFPNRKALAEALTDRAVASYGGPELAACGSAREVLAETGRWAYRLGKTQPDWSFDSAGFQGFGLLAWRQVLDRMNEFGVTDEAALAAVSVVSNYAISTGQSTARTQAISDASPRDLRRYLDHYADEASAARLAKLLSNLDLDTWFERGLRAVLTGVERELLVTTPRARSRAERPRPASS